MTMRPEAAWSGESYSGGLLGMFELISFVIRSYTRTSFIEAASRRITGTQAANTSSVCVCVRVLSFAMLGLVCARGNIHASLPVTMPMGNCVARSRWHGHSMSNGQSRRRRFPKQSRASHIQSYPVLLLSIHYTMHNSSYTFPR